MLAGGETGFINLRFNVPALTGRVLVFHNCYPGTRSLHPDSNHAGRPVAAGSKWACNLWYREKPLRSGTAARSRMVAAAKTTAALTV